MRTFPFYQQLDAMDCGATCLQMVSAFFGKKYSLSHLRQLCYTDREGVSLKAINQAAQQIGFDTMAVQMPYQAAQSSVASILAAPLPCVVHWEQNHFVVVYKANDKYIWVADPKVGKQKMRRQAFEKMCASDGLITALLLEPSSSFLNRLKEESEQARTGFSFLIPYLQPYRSLIFQLIVGLLIGSVFQLIFPFLTQAVVDIGIQNQDINFIYLILVAQLMLFLGKATVDVIQSWILLHIGTRINVSLIADFLKKLLKLPINFFDSKHIGDLLQRVDDHQRIEIFLTSATLRTIFSIFHILVFGIVLLLYHRGIFLIFLVAGIFYLLWIFLFLKKRRQIDLIRFEQMAAHQNALVEMIEGAQEIKLQGSAQRHRWAWASIQADLFRTSIRSLSIAQYQDKGASFINQTKDIFITFVAATAVIEGSMTLGMLLAVQFIVGQLSGPLQQLISFIRLTQDAKISMERLAEVHQHPQEEKERSTFLGELPKEASVVLKSVSFKYNQLSDWILKDIDLTIPYGKTTAIVGHSGSGKTSLLKLLLGFYEPLEGEIYLDEIPLQRLSKKTWRQHCGAVLQDSYVFADTIENNISESEEGIDIKRLQKAVQIANIQDFIQRLPLGLQTKLGANGNTISQGQRQRLLIARTVYKNPDYFFLDEATNALDAENELVIMNNMRACFEGKTAIVVAHRLSTVKNAHQIVVLDKGQIVEKGTHQELLKQAGPYYNLVKNQLEL